ncbi:putative retrotransposon hot spot (RHS) protein [Trypanosoma cruzi]|nr:putative retrotransposon hot spot (RHS) protein [Trypanosoma cruzi]
MSGRPESIQGSNVESQSSTVSQGGQRRARSEFEGDTDHSSATRRRLEGTYRPQWTMRSSLEEILLGGSILRTDMLLNDFLQNYVGGRAAVDEDHNVTMEMFVQEPDDYVQDQQLLKRICNLTAYQVYKLNHEGLFSLEQWKDYEGKDMVTPAARTKLNAAITQVQTAESSEVNERMSRKEEERRRRALEMKFTISTTIEDVLFKGEFCYKDMNLNDFLLMRFGGRGIIATSENVLLEEFFKDPAKYIRVKGVLNEIKTTDAYLSIEGVVREEMDKGEDVRKLKQAGVYNLQKWSEATAQVKESVHEITKSFLDAALEEANKPTTMSAPIKMEGCYESVYNSRWSHVVEVPGGEGTVMKVKEGKPKQSWTYRAVGRTLERNDGLQQSGEVPPRLMVLASDKGWPYSWNVLHGTGNDLCVNCEVERVWQIVLDDITKWFSNFHLTLNPSPLPRVLIGTPGIGKSVNAGSYLLYQLLHYDAEKLQVVAYCFGETMYVFDKTTKTVTKYKGNIISESVLDGLWQRGMKGYIIYDVAKEGTPPDPDFAPSTGWGMIVVSSPKVSNYAKWAKQVRASRIIMNCPEKDDVKAMCAWMKRNETLEKQAGYWEMVEKHMKNVGPIPRHIFDEGSYIDRMGAVDDALLAIKDTDVEEYFTLGGEEKKWYSEYPCHKLVKIVRARKVEGAEGFFNAPICTDIEFRIADRLAEKKGAKDFLLLILRSHGALISHLLEKLGLRAFMYGEFVIALLKELKELPPPSPSKPRSSVLKINHQGHPTRTVGLKELQGGVTRIPMEYGVLYIPAVQNFPLVDGFFFVDSPRKTLVGLQITTAGEHHTIPSTVSLFNERMAEYFEGWEELSRDMSWEIVYIQHENSTMIKKWQRCGPVNTENLSLAENEIVAFWNGKVHQYQFVLTTDFVNKIRAK